MRIGIIGGGVGGIFTAIELINNGFDGKYITIFDKGKDLEKRKCFVNADTPCKKCKICSIVNGVGGAGSYSDSKLNFDISGRVGGDMYELMTEEEISHYLERTYKIYQQFGIEEFQSKVYGDNHSPKAQEILEIISDNPNLDIVDCRTIHLGTDNSRIIYGRMVDFLRKNGVNILASTEVNSIYRDENDYIVNTSKGVYNFDKIVLAMGRSGNSLVRKICEDNKLQMLNGRVDYGVRVETLNEVMKPLNEEFYEAKVYFKGQFGDKARMFCSNPSGFVSIESYPYGDGQIFTANGHAYANKKSPNTNFAILVTRHFNEDTPNPLENHLYPLIHTCNSLGKGSVILQALKDIKLNRRSTKERIDELEIKPTANVYCGDLTSVIPYRTMVDILQAIEELDKICPGINGDNTLLYGLEAKFSSNKVKIDKYGKTTDDNIYCIGDCSGYCRGLTTACSMGIACTEDILK